MNDKSMRALARATALSSLMIFILEVCMIFILEAPKDKAERTENGYGTKERTDRVF